MSDQPNAADKPDPEWQPTVTSYIEAPGPVRCERRPLPSTIGAYRILALLGEGGMGTVYQAEQQNPHRTVALKVIKLGVASEQLLRRFEQEAEALGRLQHPGIAQIYEAGTADTGLGPQPYFAMEFIQGRSLIDYAAERRLNVRARLELMARICDAVNHAHQRGIIHRDLKPGNILVDETGQPKILDFGVARVANSDAQATRQTDLGQLIGTLAYMSPEQVLADPLALDIRSDVYALGVILYELLSGKLPYNINRKALHEAMQVIREEDPAPLSSIHRSYRGDIDTIVAKALEKDKTRRYTSAAELAGDIWRYLTDQPIAARPPSAAYQLQKFARRHKALVAGTAAVFLVLAGGVVVSTWEAVRARKAERSAVEQRDRAVSAETRAQQERNTALSEKQRADAEAATSKAVNDFLQNDLLAQASAANQAGPNTDPDPDLKVRTVLDRAAARIQGKFEKQPLVEASIRQTIGDTYRDLGLYPRAQQQLERALELRREVHGGQQSDMVAAMVDLADLYDRQNKEAQAEALYQKVLAIRRQALGEENPATLAIVRDLAEMYERRGKHTPAEQLFTKIIAVERRTLGQENPDLLSTMEGLATLYTNTGKFEKAEQLYAKVQEARRRTLGEEHPSFLETESDLAELYRSEAKYAEAEKIYLKVLGVQRRVLGGEHPDTLNTMNNLAGVYVGEGKFAQAEALHSVVLEIDRRVLGEQHRDTLLSMNNLALVYYQENKYEQAESLWKKALEIQVRVLGEEHRDTLITMNNLGGIYRIQRKYPEAEAMLKRAVELQTRVLGADHRNTLHTVSGLGVLYRSQGKYAEAEPLFKRVLEVRRRVLGEKHPETLDSIDNLATLYTDEGKYKEAESMLNSLVEVRRRVQGEESEDTLYTLNNQATLYREEGKYLDAEALFSKIFEARRRALGAEDLATLVAMVSLGQVGFERQRYSEAESILRQALSNFEKKNIDVWQRYQCQALLGASLASQQRYEEAESLQVAGYQGMLQREATIPFEARSTLEQAREQLAKLYVEWGKPEKAAEWKKD